jgi:hypothetical protein
MGGPDDLEFFHMMVDLDLDVAPRHTISQRKDQEMLVQSNPRVKT